MAQALLLFSRRGCCLCERLEHQLRLLEPPLPLRVCDIDVDPDLQARYALKVPVLAVQSFGRPGWRVLPRPSPRLQRAALARWLDRAMPVDGQVELPPPSPG